MLPARYPQDEDVRRYVGAENGLGHLLDVGVIVPRLRPLFAWSADELGQPALNQLLDPEGAIPSYAWDPQEAEVWDPAPSLLARAARRAVADRSR